MMMGARLKCWIIPGLLGAVLWNAQSFAARPAGNEPVIPAAEPSPSAPPPPPPVINVEDDDDSVAPGDFKTPPPARGDDPMGGRGDDISPAPRAAMPAMGANPAGAGANAPKGADAVPEGRDLVNMDFPELTDIKDIIKAVAMWTGKNVILDRNVTGKIQILSPKKVTKEEAYQAFLSALNMLNLTTVETGKVIKIMKVRNAVRGNLKTYMGSSWAPRTDEIITQIIPLKYIDARQIQNTLSRIVSSNSMIAYEPTNTLIISDSGYKVRRVLEILDLIDVQTQQPKVLIVPIKYADPANIAKKINELLKPGAGGARTQQRSSYHSYKIMVDERSNSIIIFGPPSTIHDIRDLVAKFDTKVDDPQSQATIHVRPLDYADAKKLAATLSSLTQGAKTANGARRPPIAADRSAPTDGVATVASLGNDVKITADEASNSLLITGSRSAYNSVNTLIRKLDLRRPQVFIEATVLDINEDNGLKLGTSIFAGFGSENGGTKGIVGWEAAGMAPLVIAQTQVGATGTAPAAAVAGVAQAFKSDMTIGILSGKTFDVPGLGKLTPGGLISLLKSDASTRTLASPHILTTTNEEATVTVGETLFYKSAQKDAQGVVEGKIEKEPVDLTLNIKPNISHSNYLTLKVEIDSNSVISFEEGIPRLSKRKSKQIVTVKNGQTVVVSGLMRAFESESFAKIPLLGDIPLLGWLFRNSQLRSQNTNLVIFITPYIVHGAADLAAIYQRKMEDRDNLLRSIYGGRFKKSDFYKKLPKEEDGKYISTEKDEIEEKSLKKFKQENLEAMGIGSEKALPDKNLPATQLKEQEFTVPGDLTGGGGGGGGDMPPPPPPPAEDFDDNDSGGGEE